MGVSAVTKAYEWMNDDLGMKTLLSEQLPRQLLECYLESSPLLTVLVLLAVPRLDMRMNGGRCLGKVAHSSPLPFWATSTK